VAPGCDFIQQTTKALLTFTAGQNDQVITVRTLADTTKEPSETYFVKLVSVSGAATIAHAVGTGTIINDD
jgi:hypothetical protein